jgi:hypothetical protein
MLCCEILGENELTIFDFKIFAQKKMRKAKKKGSWSANLHKCGHQQRGQECGHKWWCVSFLQPVLAKVRPKENPGSGPLGFARAEKRKKMCCKFGLPK